MICVSVWRCNEKVNTGYSYSPNVVVVILNYCGMALLETTSRSLSH